MRIDATYAGGISNSQVHIGIFNASTAPIYIASWFASFGAEKNGPSTMSFVHSKGRFPIRLQEQDRSDITVNVEDHALSELRQLGVVDGNGRWWEARKPQIELIAQKATRYASLQPAREVKGEVEEQLRQANVEINATIKEGSFGRKRFEVEFVNRSKTPITLRGAEVKWDYDPPRWQPNAPNSDIKVAEAGGTVRLSPNIDLKTPVAPGGTASFYLDDSMAGVLVETIVGDVKDKDIKVLLYTDTRIMWTATEDEIPQTIRDFARYVVETAQARV